MAVLGGGDPAGGREAAVTWCPRCHMVGNHDPYGGSDSTPRFRTFAARPGIDPPARIRGVNERPPHPSQDIRIGGPGMDDPIAYVESLGAKAVSHGRYVTFQLAEVAAPRELVQKIASRIDDPRPRPAPA